jgi:nucleotide-binding universal stress UspA family protein
VTQSAAQHLLVVSSRTRHAVAGTLLGSVTQNVLHHATCPVAVIPAAMQ